MDSMKMHHGGDVDEGAMMSGMGMGIMGSTMKMHFHFDFHEVILFDFWRINSVSGLLLSMLGCFAIGIAYEAIKYGRERVDQTCSFRKIFSGRGAKKQQPCALFVRQVLPREQSAITLHGSEVDYATTEEVGSGNGCNQAAKPTTNEVQNFEAQREKSKLSYAHMLLTLLYAVQLTVGYIMMLIAMTYNAWLFLSIVVGAVVGYFIFGLKIVGTSDHCNV